MDVVGIQRKSLPEALLGFHSFLEQEAENPIVQAVLDVALVLSYSLDKRDHDWRTAAITLSTHSGVGTQLWKEHGFPLATPA